MSTVIKILVAVFVLALFADLLGFIMNGTFGTTSSSMVTSLVSVVTTLPCLLINGFLQMLFSLVFGIINAVLDFANVPQISVPTPPTC